MANKPEAVSNAGPLIHLNEAGAVAALEVFSKLFIPEEVFNETRKLGIRKATVAALDEKHKDAAKFIASSYDLQLGESEAISLAVQKGIRLFLTDDLEARTVAKHFDLEVHGTVGILVRAFRDGIFTEQQAVSFLELLRTKSSLFITKDLLDWSIKTVREYAENRRKAKRKR